MGGQQLPVQVGQANCVAVDEGQVTDARPGQRLHHIAPHAANTEDCHMGVFQPLHGILPQQHGCAKKLFVHRDSSNCEKSSPKGELFA